MEMALLASALSKNSNKNNITEKTKKRHNASRRVSIMPFLVCLSSNEGPKGTSNFTLEISLESVIDKMID